MTGEDTPTDETGAPDDAAGSTAGEPTAGETAATESDTEETPEDTLPESVAEEARRLTRLARRATDDAEATAYREDRAERLAEYGFTSRVRETDDTLVLYPEEWLVDGEVALDRVEDTDRARELVLSGPGDPDEWDAVADHNDELVAAVGEAHGAVHRRNARVFADFMSNHYAREADTATPEEVTEFLEEYYPRNAWPTDEQRAVVEESLRHLFAAADKHPPL
ncbi:rnhA operon protein [Halobaculum sp. MBLA0147]|uniref:DUF7108 family protein n=1 Tax=Halobaculum sp. MBLA0147 TaxID=3079934 RepID=UPI0035255653